MPQPKTSDYLWTRIDKTEVDSWNEALLKTKAAYYQYPFWCEPYRLLWFSPVYLTCEHEGSRCAYVAILRTGLPGCRVGLIQNGPVNLASDGSLEVPALAALGAWAKRNGFMFLRFRNPEAELLNRVMSLGSAEQVDGFGLYGGVNNHQLLVELRESEDQMLAGFQSVARYEIRAASRAGYEIRASSRDEELAEVWPLFLRLAQRKGLSLNRPLRVWIDLVRRGTPHRCALVYTARLGTKPVQAILVVRDAVTAEYALGALDVEALGDNPSPSCLLHWYAMRDVFRLGCRYYDLGHPSGPVYQFKRKFHPTARIAPQAVTLITKPLAYRLWSVMVLRTLLPLWPRVRYLLSRAIGGARPR